ncbi:hypothetical protein AWQ22_01000 [Picosynechococcus sp. PCC 7117]|nr:hypothetical protein AWQ22_01000 [Picosynechococcus sp. PCC 7117]
MGRVIYFVILIGLCWWAAPAYGELCRVYGEQQICLVSLKRSAKYYWEYRAVLRINGKKIPVQKFDCLHNLDLANDRRKFVCSLIPRR